MNDGTLSEEEKKVLVFKIHQFLVDSKKNQEVEKLIAKLDAKLKATQNENSIEAELAGKILSAETVEILSNENPKAYFKIT